MKNIYIHPNASEKYYSFNPYIADLTNSVSSYCNVVNKNTKSNNGILHLVKYAPKVDYIWFNWIEDLPDKSKGFLQTAVLVFILFYCKLTSKKIIWTLHNKFSHYKRNQNLKRFLFWFMMKMSDFILTHSTEGVEFAGSFGKKVKAKTKFLHHPVKDSYKTVSIPKNTDILIWGSIIPYKGIDQFLDYLWSHKLEEKWKIRIIGKIRDVDYKAKLMGLTNGYIVIEDKFADDDVLKQEIVSAKCVLYTYLRDSVLSSGAVMDSITMGAHVIGPRCGAFADLKRDGIIETYSTYDELIKMLHTLDKFTSTANVEKIKTFINNNTWKSFGGNVASWLKF
jgi:hypothetical protein